VPAAAPYATSLIFWERPLGTHWLPERSFLFHKSPARDRVNAKQLSGSSGVIRPIIFPGKSSVTVTRFS
jgi:hypothetical protein